jgi:cell division septum initiation protein DivIVA
MRDQARQEAELILGNAHAEAREIQRRAHSENERLTHESRRVRAQLVEALAAFDDPQPGDAAEEAAPDSNRAEDTGEERSWYGVPDADAA